MDPNKRRTFRILTLGCKVNAYESEQYAERLSEEGFLPSESDKADIFVVNSCAVTNIAAQKCRQRIHALRRDYPDSVIAIVGCYVQTARKELSVFDDCDVVAGSFDKEKLVPMIVDHLRTGTRMIAVSEDSEPVFRTSMIRSFHQTRAYLKIQDGCNQFCSYCVIPYARGRERCMPYGDVLAQAKQLVSAEHEELVLTGIHTGRWHDGDKDLADLMKGLLDHTPGLKRLRLSSIEMNEVSDAVIDLMKEDERVARHLHIPLQAGSDPVLKGMGRPYTLAQYEKRIAEIKERIPGISISSDLIAGFPGETDEMFAESLVNIRRIGLSFLHVFPYSLRKGTKAEFMKGHVNGAVKRERVHELTKLSGELYNEFKETKLGTVSCVYVEQKIGGMWFGHSSDYLPVYIESSEDLEGQFVPVKLNAYNDEGMRGSLIA